MKHLYVIRHGETKFNKLLRMQGRGINASINIKGKEQAEAIASFLSDKPISKIVTSSLNRSIESAQPLCELFNIESEKYADLDEMNFGSLEGKPFEEVTEELKYLQKRWSSGNLGVAPEGGENPVEVFERANLKVMEVLATSNDDHIVFILHGRLIRILLSKWLGMGLQNMHKIEHQNGAINHLKWEEENFEAVKLNIVEHLTNVKA